MAGGARMRQGRWRLPVTLPHEACAGLGAVRGSPTGGTHAPAPNGSGRGPRTPEVARLTISARQGHRLAQEFDIDPSPKTSSQSAKSFAPTSPLQS